MSDVQTRMDRIAACSRIARMAANLVQFVNTSGVTVWPSRFVLVHAPGHDPAPGIESVFEVPIVREARAEVPYGMVYLRPEWDR